jgi:hypothetical protein
MTSLSEMATPKPRRECDSAPTARSHLLVPRMEPSESLTAKLLVAQQNEVQDSGNRAPDPLLQGLIDRLPKPNGIWSLDDRSKWLRTAATIFDLVYKAGDGEQREISIGFAKQDGQRLGFKREA